MGMCTMAAKAAAGENMELATITAAVKFLKRKAKISLHHVSYFN